MSNDHDGRIKLTLNRPALERLLGDDAELEMDLKHAAVKEIVGNHFTTVVENQAMRAYQDELAAKVSDSLKKEFGQLKSVNWRTEFELSQKGKETVERVVREKLKVKVAEEVDKLDLSDMIDRQVHYEVTTRIRKGVQNKLDELSQQMKS